MIQSSIYIGLGAFLGANLRAMITGFLSYLSFPYGVLFCNLGGSFLAGFFFMLNTRQKIDPNLAAMFSIGFLGSLTTFSTFALDSVKLGMNSWGLMGINVLANLCGTLLSVLAGGWLCQKIF